MPNQIIIPETEIPITETPIFYNKTWEEFHFKLADNGLYMPSPALFMHYFTKVRDAYQEKLKLKRTSGEELTQEQTRDLWNQLSTNCWAYLDAKFIEDKDSLKIETEHRIKDEKLISQKRELLEDYIVENCFVDLEFNRQGMPTKKSKVQEYKQGENIQFYRPEAGRVAWFYVVSGRASLGCDWGSGDSFGFLGVFGCGKAAQKILAPSKKLYTWGDIQRALESAKLSGIEKLIKSNL